MFWRWLFSIKNTQKTQRFQNQKFNDSIIHPHEVFTWGGKQKIPAIHITLKDGVFGVCFQIHFLKTWFFWTEKVSDLTRSWRRRVYREEGTSTARGRLCERHNFFDYNKKSIFQRIRRLETIKLDKTLSTSIINCWGKIGRWKSIFKYSKTFD